VLAWGHPAAAVTLDNAHTCTHTQQEHQKDLCFRVPPVAACCCHIYMLQGTHDAAGSSGAQHQVSEALWCAWWRAVLLLRTCLQGGVVGWMGGRVDARHCLLACWLAGLLACWLAGLLACWPAGLLDSWLDSWPAGCPPLLACMLACWPAGLLACWPAGLLAFAVLQSSKYTYNNCRDQIRAYGWCCAASPRQQAIYGEGRGGLPTNSGQGGSVVSLTWTGGEKFTPASSRHAKYSSCSFQDAFDSNCAFFGFKLHGLPLVVGPTRSPLAPWDALVPLSCWRLIDCMEGAGDGGDSIAPFVHRRLPTCWPPC